jgi:hypothetical protein
MESKRKIVEDNISLILEMESKRRPLVEVARALNIKYDTLKKYLNILGINYKCNPNRKGIPHNESRKDILEFLNGNATNSRKRTKLIECGIKEEKCECCGLSEWMGKPIPVVVDHIDGNPLNHKIENFRLVCGNCDMQLDTYKSRNYSQGRKYRRLSNKKD